MSGTRNARRAGRYHYPLARREKVRVRSVTPFKRCILGSASLFWMGCALGQAPARELVGGPCIQELHIHSRSHPNVVYLRDGVAVDDNDGFHGSRLVEALRDEPDAYAEALRWRHLEIAGWSAGLTGLASLFAGSLLVAASPGPSSALRRVGVGLGVGSVIAWGASAALILGAQPQLESALGRYNQRFSGEHCSESSP
jgi:hypothetical protein